jgi:hypothetical protein
MARLAGRHLDEEAAERYSLGQPSARKVAEIETHLLRCEPCRQVVGASDAYVGAMRYAAAMVRQQEPESKGHGAGE